MKVRTMMAVNLLADEAGLQVARVRGVLKTGNTTGPAGEAHAWNELHLEDGRRLIVDAAMGVPEIPFHDPRSKTASRCFGAEDQPLYGGR